VDRALKARCRELRLERSRLQTVHMGREWCAHTTLLDDSSSLMGRARNVSVVIVIVIVIVTVTVTVTGLIVMVVVNKTRSY
jgi:hypothetical protein